jgi:hypothetical protein
MTHLDHQHDYVEFHIFDHVQVKSDLQLNQELTDGTCLFSILSELLFTVS